MGKLDTEKERERLAKIYAAMTDEELEEVGKSPETLSDIGFEALQAEMKRRNLDWPGKELSVATYLSQGERTGKKEDAPVVIRVYRDMTAAMTDRMILEAAEIECYLFDENIVRIDWLWSNLLGGVKLVVRQTDAQDAETLLSGGKNEKFTVEGVGEYTQERCPKCGSTDVSCDELKKRIAGAGLLLGIPLAMIQRGWNCHTCGHIWEVDEKENSEQSQQ
jgi:hypothetical protein